MTKLQLALAALACLTPATAPAAVTYSFDLRVQPSYAGPLTPKRTRVTGAITLAEPLVPANTAQGGGSYETFTAFDRCDLLYEGVTVTCGAITFSQNTRGFTHDEVSVTALNGAGTFSGFFAPGSFLTNGTRFNYDGSLTTEYFSRLSTSIPGVPEPANWSLLVGGFGLAGAALRRRPSAPAAGFPA
jgi:hypothetical protein